jgi:8-oxo-dGTP diphosphatase
MGSTLDSLLAGLQPKATAIGEWGESRITMTAFVSQTLPPEELITSVRGVLIRGGSVAVMHNPGGQHPVPGGRRDGDESLLDTLRREVMEEAGCVIDEPKLLGFIHFRHVTPCPEGYPYPYPDFCQAVFAARIVDIREVVDPDGWEERVELVLVEECVTRPFDPTHAVFLDAAIAAIGDDAG